MDIDGEKLEQAVLALLYFNSWEEGTGKRAWKSFPWSVMDALHDQGYISVPATKNKWVWLSGEPSSQKNSSRSFSRSSSSGSALYESAPPQGSVASRVLMSVLLGKYCRNGRFVFSSVKPFQGLWVQYDLFRSADFTGTTSESP